MHAIRKGKKKNNPHGVVINTMPGQNPTLPLSRSELSPLVRKALSVLGLSDREFELTLVKDGEMARLNEKFLGRVGPTNILSFPEQDPAAPNKLGLMVLSVDALSREARLYGQDPRSHLVRLLCHGLLHLAGFSHGPEMDRLTEAAVKAI
ncbi:MAG: rRNA maturation RNase YbeY [Thermodesulfobacteriota bacterium]|nr:rRNA maturation RNase YbeY [Thermodesulfobacteriota bacterium]